MHFGGRTTQDEAFRIMDAALDMGINFFDTANVYGGAAGRGATEEIIGAWLSQGGGRRDRIVLATKVYGHMVAHGGPNQGSGVSAYKVRKHIADSLRRLQTDHVDLYQVHHIDWRVSGEEFWGTFERLVDRGDALYLGTSNYPGWGLAKYQMQALQRGRLGLVSEQTQYNLLNRIPELEVLPAARDFGIGVLAYMPLAGGLLAGKAVAAEGSRTADVEREYGMRVDRDAQFAEFKSLCQDLGEPEQVVAIAWTLRHPAVCSAIVGVRRLDHLEGLARAAALELTPDALARLEAIFDINRGRALRPGAAPAAYAW
jgi:aryl-alcohol dehydrogenase-like predicted oxidoreductase